jgi:energy-coupling factor transport system permease protein
MAATLFFVILVFSATNWIQLLILAAISSIPLWYSHSNLLLIVRVLLRFRWLLLFTFLLHIFLSPGKTITGISWLSLDGVFSGSFVCLQMMIATLMSLSFAITTSAEAVASSSLWFLKPINLSGLKTHGWEEMIVLVLSLIPLVYQEFENSKKRVEEKYNAVPFSFSQSFKRWFYQIELSMDNLIYRMDQIAVQRVMDEKKAAPLQTFAPLSSMDYFFVFFCLLVLTSYLICG